MDPRSEAEYWRFMNDHLSNATLSLFSSYVHEMTYEELLAVLVHVDLCPNHSLLVIARIIAITIAQGQQQQH
jgi:hypothetical protein